MWVYNHISLWTYSKQDILAHHRQKEVHELINIYITVTCWWNKEIASVETKQYKIVYHNLLAIHFTLIRIQINHLNNMWNFKKTHMSSFHKRNKHNEVFPCYKRIRKIETVFKRLKIIRAKHWQCLTKSYLTTIFKSRATYWSIVSQNETSLHNNNTIFELRYDLQRYCLFSI